MIVDLEALAIDISFRRFRSYILGSPNETVVIMDHFPIISIFNGKRSGYTRAKRIKLRLQNIRFYVTYNSTVCNCYNVIMQI